MTRSRKPKKICFFVTPIGKGGSQERDRANKIQRHILMEVLAPKFKIVRADELSQPGSITHQIINLLYTADLVVADLTGSNANVAYELAVRHAFNKVSIHLVDRADEIPFDLKDERTIVFDLSDVDSVSSCKDELERYIGTMFKGKFQYSSPVFRTLGVAAATTEEKAGFLDKTVDEISAIASSVSTIETNIGFTDFDNIDDIKSVVDALQEQINSLEESQDELGRDVRNIDVKVQKLLDRGSG